MCVWRMWMDVLYTVNETDRQGGGRCGKHSGISYTQKDQGMQLALLSHETESDKHALYCMLCNIVKC